MIYFQSIIGLYVTNLFITKFEFYLLKLSIFVKIKIIINNDQLISFEAIFFNNFLCLLILK